MLKGNKLLAAVLVAGSAVLGGGCNCGARLAINGDTTVTISSPANNQSFLTTDMITFTAAADNAAGLTSLVLQVGIDQLISCPGSGAATTHIDCTQSFAANDPTFSTQIGGGQLVLTAVGTSAAGVDASVSVTVTITAPISPDAGPPDAGPVVWFLQFVQPMVSTGFPPTATVAAPSVLQMAIVDTPPTPIATIVVADEHGNTIASWTTVPYQSTINWQTTPGPGVHTLTGTATDQTGDVQTANIVLTVNNTNCTSDASCITGSRCCLDDGQCHPIVAENAACDCAHPCPTDEGCLPGTCGKLPQQCRPACNPGSESQVPDVCAPINGVQAYCDPLPPSQVTAANKGGACAPGDGCDIKTQNCPMAPLDPGSDAGPPANPIVAYSCEPAGMNGNNEATVCFPAGTWPPQPNSPNNHCEGETDTCGSDTLGCVPGYECVWEENLNGTINTAAGPACSQQCTMPNDGNGFNCPPQNDCPAGYFCGELMGNGNQLFSSGVCIKQPRGC